MSVIRVGLNGKNFHVMDSPRRKRSRKVELEDNRKRKRNEASRRPERRRHTSRHKTEAAGVTPVNAEPSEASLSSASSAHSKNRTEATAIGANVAAN